MVTLRIMIIGHLAFPAILRHYFPELEAAPLYAGSLFPDVMDKGLHSLELALNGRSIAHTLFSLITTTTIIAIFLGKKLARSWAIGYLGHLICDSGGDVPWLYPFTTYTYRISSRNLWQKIKRWLTNPNPFEIILTLWAMVLFIREQFHNPWYN